MGGVNNRAINRIYDIATQYLERRGRRCPCPHLGHGHVYANGKIYVIGGLVDGAIPMQSMPMTWRLTLGALRWRRCRRLSTKWLVV